MSDIKFTKGDDPLAPGAALTAELEEGLLAVWLEGDGFGGHRAEIIFFKDNDMRQSYSSRNTQDWPELEKVFNRSLWLPEEYAAHGLGADPHPQLVEAFNEYKAEYEAWLVDDEPGYEHDQDAAAIGDVQEVTVYSQPDCMGCKMTANVLDQNGIPYRVVDLTTDDQAREYVMQRLGYRTAPVVETTTGEHWAGFRPDLITQIQPNQPKGTEQSW